MSLLLKSGSNTHIQIESNLAHKLIFRWHFYAGIFCIPFIFILCISGAIYLFRPQIDAFLDKPYDKLTSSANIKPIEQQVEAALLSVPNGRLKSIEFRPDITDALRVHIFNSKAVEMRVLVHPETLQILHTEIHESRLSRLMVNLHGNLFLGDFGAVIMELVGAWAIILILTGLYLWWPKTANAFSGILFPKMNLTGRSLYKQIHSAIGVWLSIFGLFFLVSGLPWTKIWGEGFSQARSYLSQYSSHTDWRTGPSSEKKKLEEEFNKLTSIVVHGHVHNDEIQKEMTLNRTDLTNLSNLIEIAKDIHFTPPVFIIPPNEQRKNWKIESMTQNRPLRESVEFDAINDTITNHEGFSDKVLIDQIIAVGVAAHEGQLFGFPNQLIALFVVICYLISIISALKMWLGRKPANRLGAPPFPSQKYRYAPLLVILIAFFGVFLPTLGISLILVFLIENYLIMFAPNMARWAGLIYSDC